MSLKSRASLTCFQACFLPGRVKDLSAHRYDVTVEVYLMCNSHFTWFLLTRLRGRMLRPEQPQHVTTQQTADVMRCRLLSVIAWARNRKTAFRILKLEGCHGEMLDSEPNTTLPLESGKIPDMNSLGKVGSVSSPLCVWKLERVCSQTQLCRLRCLMAILDNYMFRPILAIFRLSSRELKVLLYI